MSRLLLAVGLGVLASACGQTLDLVPEGPDQGVGLMLGESCGGSTDCASAHCVDGVCCDTACIGVCEACNVDGAKGSCSPVPAMTDPAMECMPKPIEMVDGGTNDGGTQLNLPDAGLDAMSGPCAPKCDGNRACGYPGSAVACGETFCNDTVNLGAAVCDGEGRCGVNLTPCVAYQCGGNACKTSCVSDGDCQGGYFCNSSGACQEKKDLGVSCGGNPSECASGFCADGVCCNADCGTISGGKCNNVGAVGTCKCTVTVPITKICDGTCEYYYPDTDGDSYGAKTGAVVGCTGDPDNSPPPPPGYVTNSDDCADDDGRVKPGADYSTATNWISAHQPTYDWDCDGAVSQQYPYRAGATCRYCSPATESIFGGTCGGSSTTSVVANQYALLDCSEAECTGASKFTCITRCCGQGCSSANTNFGISTWAFVSNGYNCGMPGTMRWCYSQGGAVGSPLSAPDDFTMTQGCK